MHAAKNASQIIHFNAGRNCAFSKPSSSLNAKYKPTTVSAREKGSSYEPRSIPNAVGMNQIAIDIHGKDEAINMRLVQNEPLEALCLPRRK